MNSNHSVMHYVMRLKLIDRLKEDDKIDDILKEFADTLEIQ